MSRLEADHAQTIALAKRMHTRNIWRLKDLLRDDDLTPADRTEIEAAIATERQALDDVDQAEREFRETRYENPDAGRIERARIGRAARKRRKRMERLNGK